MKLIILFALTVTATSAFAKGQVYCKADGAIVNVQDTDSAFECQGALYTGEVCFTGDAREAAVILNSQFVRDAFDGTDGEFIRNARVKSKDKIAYTSVDLANEMSSKQEINRCEGTWFRN